MAQRARRDRERLQRPPMVPRFFPSLTPSRRQRAQIERAKAKRPLIPSDTMLEGSHGRPMTTNSSTSGTINLPLSFETRAAPEFQESCLQNREKSIVAQQVQMGQHELKSRQVIAEISPASNIFRSSVTKMQFSGNLIRAVQEGSSQNREKGKVTKHVKMGEQNHCIYDKFY